MKKELLIASALVGSLGLAGVAEAATATMSGHQRVGVQGTDVDSADASNTSSQLSGFSVSISETTDSGITISTGFDLAEENGGLDASGLTLAFASGAKLDLIEAGNAATTHVATVPSGSGEFLVTAGTVSNAPSAITFADAGDNVGFEFHTAADAFGVEGLKASISFSTNGDAANTTGVHTDAGMYSVGASYVSTAGDSTVTIGAGMYQGSSTATDSLDDTEAFVISASAVTGNLTIGLGYANGTDMGTGSTTNVDGEATAWTVTGASVVTAGAKYVSGDMTLSVGVVDGSGNDGAAEAAVTGSDDSYNATSASVDYAVASGVTATVGYSAIQRGDDGASVTANSGSSWYIGATVSF